MADRSKGHCEPCPQARLPVPELLKGQAALVTGASSGIGKAVASALAASGATVAVYYARGAEAAREVVETIRATGGRAMAVEADVSNEVQVQAMFAEVIREFGTVDILVNNAGLQKDAPIEDMSLEEWNAVIGANLAGQFLCARGAIGEFRRRGVERRSPPPRARSSA